MALIADQPRKYGDRILNSTRMPQVGWTELSILSPYFPVFLAAAQPFGWIDSSSISNTSTALGPISGCAPFSP